MNSSHGLCKCTAGATAQRRVIENFQTGVKQSQNLESTSLSTFFFFLSFFFRNSSDYWGFITDCETNSYTICTCSDLIVIVSCFFHWTQHGCLIKTGCLVSGSHSVWYQLKAFKTEFWSDFNANTSQLYPSYNNR